MSWITIKVTNIEEGDRFGGDRAGWTATENAERLTDGTVSVRVQYRDGGISDRIWDDPDTELELEVER